MRTPHVSLAFVLLASCAAPSAPLGQPLPGEVPALFAPGVVSTPDAIELNGVLAPDGRELLFTRIVDGEYVMYGTRVVDGAWTAPEPLRPYGAGRRALVVDMAYAPDGQRLYFLGAAPREPFPDADPPLDLWSSGREGEGWSLPEMLPAPLSTDADEIYPVAVADGSLYFTSDRAGGHGKSDVYRAQRRADGGFAAPVNLGPAINTEHSEGDTWVSPDERVLVLASSRPGGFGQADLYVSFRTPDGGWSPPANLGPTLNTAEHEYCPMGTWAGVGAGRWLFFSRRDGAWETATTGDVFWIDAGVLERFRP
jgi:hypothetical protein